MYFKSWNRNDSFDPKVSKKKKKKKETENWNVTRVSSSVWLLRKFDLTQSIELGIVLKSKIHFFFQ